ncbi:MAG: major capsid protein [Pseudomonadota bacterium]|nr:major capsid protein [Pseudomonadota bacterium]
MPHQGPTRISRALSNISVKYTNEDYIFPKVFTETPVVHDTDSFWVYNSEFRLPETVRANGSPANMATWEASTATYVVQEHALKDVITDTDRDNTEAPLDLEKDTTEYLTDKILLRQEYEAMRLLFTTTSFSTNATLTTATSWDYNATTTSAPIQNALSATGAIIQNSGMRPNKMVMGWEVFEALKENNNVYGRIQYVERAIITEEILASVFDVPNLYVGTSVYDQAKEGATASQTFLWGDDCVIGYFNPLPGRKKVTAATVFRVAKKGTPYRVKKWYEEDIEGTFVEVQTKFQFRAVATSAAFLFKACTLV